MELFTVIIRQFTKNGTVGETKKTGWSKKQVVLFSKSQNPAFISAIAEGNKGSVIRINF